MPATAQAFPDFAPPSPFAIAPAREVLGLVLVKVTVKAVPGFVLPSAAVIAVPPYVRGLMPAKVRTRARRLLETWADLRADHPKDAQTYRRSGRPSRPVDFLFRLAANCGALPVA